MNSFLGRLQLSACAIHSTPLVILNAMNNSYHLFTPCWYSRYTSCDSFRFIFMSSMKSAKVNEVYFICVWFMADMWNRFHPYASTVTTCILHKQYLCLHNILYSPSLTLLTSLSHSIFHFVLHSLVSTAGFERIIYSIDFAKAST